MAKVKLTENAKFDFLLPEHNELYKQLSNKQKAELAKRCQLLDFINNLDDAPLRFGKTFIFTLPKSKICCAFVEDRRLYVDSYYFPSTLDCFANSDAVGDLSKSVPAGLIVEKPTKRKSHNHGNTILLNGDDSDESELENDQLPYMSAVGKIGNDYPTMSFNCIGNFYNSRDEAIQRLLDGTLKIVDFTPDENIKPSREELNKINQNKNLSEIIKDFKRTDGFTLIGIRKNIQWHRSGTVLLHDIEKDWYILMGQDEGTYFGVELPKPVKTVNQAYKSLVPDEVKGKAFLRQGEWFVVKVPNNQVPAIKDCVICFEKYNYSIFLPVESDDSNRHHIEYCKSGRVGKDGKLYVQNVSLTHNEHEIVTMNGWSTFYKNTAVRSFSQEGVD